MPTNNFRRPVFNLLSPFSSFPCLIIVLLLFCFPVIAQVQRDSTAVNSLAAAITQLGGIPPRDSTATATIAVTSGGSSQQGSIEITTRGMNQTSEDITLPNGSQKLVYSLGASNDKRVGAKPGEDQNSFELSLSAQSPMFPLPWLADRFADTDVAIVSLGNEVLKGVAVMHLQLTNTFNSTPNQKHYSSFTTADVWLDAKTNLPAKISYERRSAGGPVAPIPISYEYSDYRNIQGVLYPFQIRKSVNGTLWGVITVQSVQFNTGVADAAFALQ